MGLQYATEENAGRIYVNLTGGAADLGSVPSPYDNQHQQQSSHHQYPSQQYHQQPQQQQQHGGQNQQQDGVEQVVNAILPRVLRKLEKACCVVM